MPPNWSMEDLWYGARGDPRLATRDELGEEFKYLKEEASAEKYQPGNVNEEFAFLKAAQEDEDDKDLAAVAMTMAARDKRNVSEQAKRNVQLALKAKQQADSQIRDFYNIDAMEKKLFGQSMPKQQAGPTFGPMEITRKPAGPSYQMEIGTPKSSGGALPYAQPVMTGAELSGPNASKEDKEMYRLKNEFSDYAFALYGPDSSSMVRRPEDKELLQEYVDAFRQTFGMEPKYSKEKK